MIVTRKNVPFNVSTNLIFGNLSRNKLPDKTASPCYTLHLHEVNGSEVDRNNYMEIYEGATPLIQINKHNPSAYYVKVEMINDCGLERLPLRANTIYHVYCEFNLVPMSYS